MDEAAKPVVVDELDRLRYSLAAEKIKHIQAEMASLRLQLAQLNQDLLAAVDQNKKLNKQLAEKYGLKEGDSFSVVTGEVHREKPA